MSRGIGDNGGPPLDDDIPGLRGPHQLDERLVRRAWKVLKIICVVFDEDPLVIAGKRNPVNQLLIRKVWYAVMKAHFEPDAIVLEKLADVRERVADLDEDDPRYPTLKAEQRTLREEARGKVWMLAAMAGLDRGTACDDQADIERWCERNTMLFEQISQARELADLSVVLMESKEDILYELRAERDQDAEDRKRINDSLALIKASADLLDAKPRLVVSNQTPQMRKRA